jgi:hypothetical protein
VTGLIGDMAVADNNTTVENNSSIVRGTTIGHYQKPGAPIDITYSTKRVVLDEISDVNITLTTPMKEGEMEVDIDIDKNLKVDGATYNKITFSLNPNQTDYKINLKVSSNKDGLYYIRLLTKINGAGSAKMRAFAVPVYVGNGKLQKQSKQLLMKAFGGENLSISNAEETVEILK